ncbi:MAG: histidine--tRNA ligase [Chlorobi bacterium]|nr:histidine--tRNA ligase [Chlorobiota bacterium]
MSVLNPSIPKGTRDFTPVEAIRRKYIFSVIENVFTRYGYLPIETPAMENLTTLLGKYGDEGDRLIFKILDSGNFLTGVTEEERLSLTPSKLAGRICEKGLRYDLTVPFARFVVRHRNKLSFPFKRYQIQPVWRADRPQKGRYREFYQCDVDVIGSRSLLNEAELLMIMEEVFRLLGIKVVIKLNHRKILAGIAEYMGVPDKLTGLTQALDKRNKIGDEKVLAELRERGFDEPAVRKMESFLSFSGSNNEKISFLSEKLGNTGQEQTGLDEMAKILTYAAETGVDKSCEFDFTLARGLDYYTGTIFEVVAAGWDGGSICGGGRYDDLTGIFGLPDVSGVGVSFGADRIYDVLAQTGKFPPLQDSSTQVLFLNFGEKELSYILPLVRKLRDHNVAAEVYPDQAKIKKQMQYANQKNIPFVILTGEEEMSQGVVSLKNMETGRQIRVTFEEVADSLIKK